MKNRKKLTGARAVGLLRYLPLILLVAFFVFAFGWIVLASFSTTKEIFSNGLLQAASTLKTIPAYGSATMSRTIL